MPKRDRKHMTLRERAQKWAKAKSLRGTNTFMHEVCYLKGYKAGWHARGRADRVTKAVVDAAVAYVQQTMLIQSTVSRVLGTCPDCSPKDGKHEAHCMFGPLQHAVANLTKGVLNNG